MPKVLEWSLRVEGRFNADPFGLTDSPLVPCINEDRALPEVAAVYVARFPDVRRATEGQTCESVLNYTLTSSLNPSYEDEWRAHFQQQSNKNCLCGIVKRVNLNYLHEFLDEVGQADLGKVKCYLVTGRADDDYVSDCTTGMAFGTASAEVHIIRHDGKPAGRDIRKLANPVVVRCFKVPGLTDNVLKSAFCQHGVAYDGKMRKWFRCLPVLESGRMGPSNAIPL